MDHTLEGLALIGFLCLFGSGFDAKGWPEKLLRITVGAAGMVYLLVHLLKH